MRYSETPCLLSQRFSVSSDAHSRFVPLDETRKPSLPLAKVIWINHTGLPVSRGFPLDGGDCRATTDFTSPCVASSENTSNFIIKIINIINVD